MKDNIITVSQLTNLISNLLRTGVGTVSVQGEISNYILHSSGHRYFSMKEEGAAISCVMWRTRTINFQPADGMKVIARGNITVYPPRGQYQLECTSLTPLGQGDLYLSYEALKKRLEEEGYFDRDIKKPLPKLPLTIGVITSPTGAAIRDIFSTIERRFSVMKIYFRPTLVQGEGAAEDIAMAIEELNKTDAELIMSGRGGGSIEDIWPFNEEIVAKAIFQSKMPIISAVGHETDFTLSDFVADMRAATPTAAAELATPVPIDSIRDFIDTSRLDMSRSIRRLIESKKEVMLKLANGNAFKRVTERINTYKREVDESENRISKRISQIVEVKRQRIKAFEQMMQSLYPLSPLRRGFALLKSKGRIIGKEQSLRKFSEIDIVRELETTTVKVIKIKQDSLF